jgi:hypothetical protein
VIGPSATRVRESQLSPAIHGAGWAGARQRAGWRGPRRSDRDTGPDRYTADDHFIVDRHPASPQVLLGCGISGRGYKYAPTAGEILADLATDGTTRHDIAFFSVRRFAPAAGRDEARAGAE